MIARCMVAVGCVLALASGPVFAEATSRSEAGLNGRYRLGAYLSSDGESSPSNSNIESGYIITGTDNNTLLVKHVQYDDEHRVVQEFGSQEFHHTPVGWLTYNDELDGPVSIQLNADGKLVYTFSPQCACNLPQAQLLERLD